MRTLKGVRAPRTLIACMLLVAFVALPTSSHAGSRQCDEWLRAVALTSGIGAQNGTAPALATTERAVVEFVMHEWTNGFALVSLTRATPVQLPTASAIKAFSARIQECSSDNRQGLAPFFHAVLDATKTRASQRTLRRALSQFDRAGDSGVPLALIGGSAVSLRLGDHEGSMNRLVNLRRLDPDFTNERIGLMLYAGVVFERNPAFARNWLESAAWSESSAVAQYLLFRMYTDGDGVAADKKMAANWFSQYQRNSQTARDRNAEEAIMDSMTGTKQRKAPRQ
jgi:hypothetical protein